MGDEVFAGNEIMGTKINATSLLANAPGALIAREGFQGIQTVTKEEEAKQQAALQKLAAQQKDVTLAKHLE